MKINGAPDILSGPIGLGGAGYDFATGADGIGLEVYYQNIRNFFSGIVSLDDALTAMDQWGVTIADVAAAMGQTTANALQFQIDERARIEAINQANRQEQINRETAQATQAYQAAGIAVNQAQSDAQAAEIRAFTTANPIEKFLSVSNPIAAVSDAMTVLNQIMIQGGDVRTMSIAKYNYLKALQNTIIAKIQADQASQSIVDAATKAQPDQAAADLQAVVNAANAALAQAQQVAHDLAYKQLMDKIAAEQAAAQAANDLKFAQQLAVEYARQAAIDAANVQAEIDWQNRLIDAGVEQSALDMAAASVAQVNAVALASNQAATQAQIDADAFAANTAIVNAQNQVYVTSQSNAVQQAQTVADNLLATINDYKTAVQTDSASQDDALVNVEAAHAAAVELVALVSMPQNDDLSVTVYTSPGPTTSDETYWTQQTQPKGLDMTDTTSPAATAAQIWAPGDPNSPGYLTSLPTGASPAATAAQSSGGIGLDAMYQNIANYLATNPTVQQIKADMKTWGVSIADVAYVDPALGAQLQAEASKIPVAVWAALAFAFLRR